MQVSLEQIRINTVIQMVVTIVPLVFAFLHFLFYLFYPRLKINLYYALFTASIAATEFFVYELMFVSDSGQRATISFLSDLLSFPLLLFGLLFLYSLQAVKPPKQFWLFIAVASVLAVWMWFDRENSKMPFLLYALAVLIEMTRIIGLAIKRKVAGIWLIAAGFMLFIATGGTLVLFAAGVLKGIFFFHAFWTIGVLGLLWSMSAYLSRNFAQTNKDLEHQLIEVKQLSKKMLQQEREAKKREIERELLRAENERKSRELEEARQLQLAMLPHEEPQLPEYEIAAAMQTANEVGGDYYDFVVGVDGSLTIAIGDATGHGTRSGMVVTSTKTLFNLLTEKADILDFFRQSNQILRDMRLGNLYMAMTIAQFTDHRMTTSAAGMPPILIFREETSTVEEIISKGMPLGGAENYPYQKQEVRLHTGDTILMMTDGFEELFNEKGEMFDYPRVKASFERTASQSPKEIVRELFKTAAQWRNASPQNDDITFIALKVK